jgi:outer membrane protein insertion porin family
VDNPTNPRNGKAFAYSLNISGGPLGGNVNTITNVFDFKRYQPTYHKRNVIEMHVSTAYTTGYGGGEVPPFSRFYMGGENDIRGFDIRSISPVTFIPTTTQELISYHDPTAGGTVRSFTIPVLTYTATLPGGDFQTYGNFGYRIPLVGPVTATLFADVGTNGILNPGALHLDPSGLSTLQTQFPSSGVTGKLPISSGTNFRVRGSTGIEFGVRLPIVQAPFRVYYAYNVNRLHSEIVAKAPFIDPSEINILKSKDEFPDPTIFPLQIAPQLNFLANNPGRLNYFEPRTTFRFTVGKTF